jgi:thiamine biosynthesis lipoprotein ApbE
VLTLARHAMATRFELVLAGGDPVALRAAGEEALDEIERLEERLSLFRPSSEIAHLNARAGREPVRVTPGLFRLLQHAQRLHAETLGAFDITIAPLVRCWGFMGSQGRIPSPEELAQARAQVGTHLLELAPEDFTVRFAREGVMLDLGAIGKGYAIERACELLREAGVHSALLHGGTSTVYGLGHPPESDSWRVAVPRPVSYLDSGSEPERDISPHAYIVPQEPTPGFPLPPALLPSESTNSRAEAARSTVRVHTQSPEEAPHLGIIKLSGRKGDEPTSPPAPLTVVRLRDQALSVSAVWGKFFRSHGRSFGHIIDPRDGQPATQAVLSAVAVPSATESDALSTALLTLGPEGHDHIAGLRPGARTLVVAESSGGLDIRAWGLRVPGREP